MLAVRSSGHGRAPRSCCGETSAGRRSSRRLPRPSAVTATRPPRWRRSPRRPASRSSSCTGTSNRSRSCTAPSSTRSAFASREEWNALPDPEHAPRRGDPDAAHRGPRAARRVPPAVRARITRAGVRELRRRVPPLQVGLADHILGDLIEEGPFRKWVLKMTIDHLISAVLEWIEVGDPEDDPWWVDKANVGLARCGDRLGPPEQRLDPDAQLTVRVNQGCDARSAPPPTA